MGGIAIGIFCALLIPAAAVILFLNIRGQVKGNCSSGCAGCDRECKRRNEPDQERKPPYNGGR